MPDHLFMRYARFAYTLFSGNTLHIKAIAAYGLFELAKGRNVYAFLNHSAVELILTLSLPLRQPFLHNALHRHESVFLQRVDFFSRR